MLEYRLGFARRVLRTELFASSVLGLRIAAPKLRVGEHEVGSDPPAWYFTYTEVGRNVEGKKLIEEVQDMFEDLSEDSDPDY